MARRKAREPGVITFLYDPTPLLVTHPPVSQGVDGWFAISRKYRPIAMPVGWAVFRETLKNDNLSQTIIGGKGMPTRDLTTIATEIQQGWTQRYRFNPPTDEGLTEKLQVVHGQRPICFYPHPQALIEAIPDQEEYPETENALREVTVRLEALANKLAKQLLQGEAPNMPIEVSGRGALGMAIQEMYAHVVSLVEPDQNPLICWMNCFENYSVPRLQHITLIQSLRALHGPQVDLSVEDAAWVDALETLMVSGAFWVPLADQIAVAPGALAYINADGRLHRESGPAVSYAGDTWGPYLWKGMRVPEQVIMRPETITVAQIDGERNVELRRVLIERMGSERFVREAKMVKVHEDSFGILWRRDQRDDEAIVVVEMINSTPEPDGTYKHYFHRVPPESRTAHEAVAWQFGLTPETYQPAIET